MFRFVLTILTATTFVAHGLFGCCWHHGHLHVVSRVDCAIEGGAKQSQCHEHGHHRHGHDETPGKIAAHDHACNHESHSPLDGECDEAHCVFARTQDGPQLSSDVLMACVASVVAVPGDSPSLPTAEKSAFATRNHNASLSAPACALSQVWLI